MKRFIFCVLFCLLPLTVQAQSKTDSLQHPNPEYTEPGHDTVSWTPREKMLEMDNRRQAKQLRKYKESWEERISITILITLVGICAAIAGFSN